jgi:hypothetical protein
LLERLKQAGFATARLLFVSSQRHGIVGADINGVFVFVTEVA